MPWHISNSKAGCYGFAVVKDSDQSIVTCHATEDKAKAHLAALYASERTMNMNNELPEICQCENRTDEQRASVMHDSKTGAFGVFRQMFFGRVIERELHLCSIGGYTDHGEGKAIIDRFMVDAQTGHSSGYHTWLNETDDGVTRMVTLDPDGHWDADFAGVAAHKATRGAMALEDLLPDAKEEVHRGTTRVRFWNNSAFGPSTRVRRLQTPEWSTVKQNYPEATRSSIEDLMGTDKEAGLAVWHSVPGTGKAQPLSSPVLTPQGWRTMGGLKVGDFVIGSDGKPTEVLGVYPQGEREIARVTFNDGAEVECDWDHLWTVRDNNSNRWRTVTTQQMFKGEDIVFTRHKRPEQVISQRKWSAAVRAPYGQLRLRVPMLSAPIEYNEQDLPIDPYTLGAWLGDGLAHTGVICGEDHEIFSRVVSIGYEQGPSLEVRDDNPNYGSFRFLGLSEQLKSLGLIRNKFLPEQYLMGTKDERLALLQGLMDTDGDVRPTSSTFNNSNEQIIDSVVKLVRSLGGIARKSNPRYPKYTYNNEVRTGKASWRVSINLPEGLCPFSISRKASIWSPNTKYNPNRLIESIDPSGRSEGSVCIRVDADDSLYVTKDYVLTHNTYAIRALVETWQERFDIDYVIDPDEFFGDASYMVSALLDSGDRTRLLIVEDAGEFIRGDARGQGLSRLLNVADGLVGQGMRTLILLTTNETMDNLHPALIRAGRCISNIEFGRFGAAEASEWLGSTVDRDMTLAELYAARTAEEARNEMSNKLDESATDTESENDEVRTEVLAGDVVDPNGIDPAAEVVPEEERSLDLGEVVVEEGDARAKGENPFASKPSTDSSAKTDTSADDEDEDEGKKARSRILSVPAVAKRSIDSALRVDHRNLPTEVMERLGNSGLDVGVVDRAGRGLFETRFQPELRTNDDGTVAIHGYATVYGHAYDVAGGAPYGFSETIARGAADRSVSERSDVRLLVNHDGIALARTRSGTLRLESDETGLYIEAPSLDPQSPLVQSLASAMRRKDMDEMSFAFRVLDDEWDDAYVNRTINEVMLFDVSVVTYPANPAAVALLKGDRAGEPDAEKRDAVPGMSLEHAQWLAEELG